MISKPHLRKTILQYRKLLAPETFDSRNQQLLNLLGSFMEKQEVKSIHTFLAIRKNNEPDISPIFPNWWSKGMEIVVSKTDFQHKTLTHFILNKHSQLHTNKWGIPEPIAAEQVEIETRDIGIIFVPLLLADKKGNRIGYGGGFYDQFLKTTKALKVGISITNPVDTLPQAEAWDIPLDYLITPFKVYESRMLRKIN